MNGANAELSPAWQRLLHGILKGEMAAAARVCRLVDEQVDGHEQVLSRLYAASRSARVIGVTGSPGVGKSTLVGCLIASLRKMGQRVGVVAVDPSSPFSGGAILGDRIRMQAHAQDPEVFIRSLATRGALGGLSVSTVDVARVLAAWGAQTVIVETVGVGQDEADILALADHTLVVNAPGAGDDLQAAKAGLMECADILLVNKADLAGAERLCTQLEQAIALGRASDAELRPSRGHVAGAPLPTPVSKGADWVPPVMSVVASSGKGVEELLQRIDEHGHWLHSTPMGRGQRIRKYRTELALRARYRVLRRVRHSDEKLWAAAERMCDTLTDPYAETEALLQTCS